MKLLAAKLPLFIFITIIGLGQMGCSSYVNKMHREFTYEKRKQNAKHYKDDPFDRFRQNQKNAKIKDPITYSRPSTRVASDVAPSIKRRYSTGSKRFTADDLVDQGNSGSLWSDQGQGNYLFSKNKRKRYGDIVLIKVMKKLKEEISSELNNRFPVRKKKKKGEKGAKETTTPPAPETPAVAQAAASEEKVGPDHVYDTISSTIVEEIQNDYLLIRGNKELLFRKHKHTVEVQALVNRKDLAQDDSVTSIKILETNVRVIR